MPYYPPAATAGNTTYTAVVGSAPGSPANGDQWWPPDGGGLSAVRVSGAWQWYYQGAPVVLPVDGDYSWTNQRSTTKDTSDGTVYLAAPADATDSISMRLKTIPSTPYTVIARLEFGLWSIGTMAAGLICRDSSSQNFSMFGHYGASGNILHHFLDTGDSTPHLTAGVLDTNGAGAFWPWWKITDDGTTRKYYVGWDGAHWLQHSSQSHTSPNTPNQIGFGLESRNATYPASLRVISWAEYNSVI